MAETYSFLYLSWNTETGIGKTVNGLRKNEFVGELAKSLVAQWKKLVPQEIPRTAEPEEREYSKSSSQKRPRSPSPEEDLNEYEDELEDSYRSHSGSGKEQYSDHEDSEDGRSYSPEPTYNLQNVSRDRIPNYPPKLSKEQKYSHKEKHKSETKSHNAEKKKEKTSLKEMHDFPSYSGSSREKLPSPESREHSHKKEKHRHTVSKNQADDPLDSKKQKHHDKSKSDKPKMDTQSYERNKMSEKDSEPAHRDKSEKNKSKTKSGEQGSQEKKSIKISVPPADPELDDEFEQPTMSFESYLSYDQPQKKKKKTAPKPASAPEKSNKKVSDGKTDRKEVSKHKSKSSSDRRDKKETSAYLSKMDQVPVLPDIPLPMIQPNYRPLPSIEPVQFSPHKRKAPLLSSEEEESAGFTGRRFNSKMQVYSGSKTAYLPKMMSLYEQCIRVLANNIDSIYEVGGVPFSVLEPVLEKCTPEQLYRIEEYNHVLVEDTDQLWRNHCQRDFKKGTPEEFESWRELYLRLHEAREKRLQTLTENIRSAHANKPKVRQAKMAFVNTEVKPPRDVRRRQEKFGTGAALVNEKIRVKPFTPVNSSSSSSSSSSSNNHMSSDEPHSYEGPSTSCTVPPPPSSVQSGHDSRKPQVKKVAPMMAKTIKAFKNRFSRR
uniref:Elongin-A n=1 Tax=Pyxicephalus adspersus TaxID=30357 RepID=A0AAV3B267_PYXAD|nr:TPA: hypothetical protein GDO54_001180 [Pyxicephalus adspersus]